VLGASVRRGAEQLRAQIVQATAALLEAAVDDIELADHHAGVRGVPGRRLAFAEIARRVLIGDTLDPDDCPTFDVTVHHRLDGPTYSNACHACTVELDADTGAVKILDYVVSEDCGVRINPAIVEGQVMGGVAQGIAGALYEELVYDDAGTPLTASFAEYLVPSAVEIPAVVHGHVVTPSGYPGGIKGMGEGGAIGAPPCVANAVADALHPLAARPDGLPYKPSTIWTTLQTV
jgi:carbon-monoxide dehydrogenase large subunit